MSIRQEHLEAYERGLDALNENIELGQSLLMDKGSIEKKIESGFNLIGNLGQAYQTVQNTKAILNKGSNVVKKTANALSNSQEEARTTDTGAEQLAPDLEEGGEASIEAFRDRLAPDLFQRLQQTGLQEGGLPQEIVQEQTRRAFGDIGDLPEQLPELIDAGATPLLDSLSEGEITTRMIESAGITGRRATQGALSQVAPETEEGPGLSDQLAPMRQLMGRGTQPLAPSELQQRMADFDPEGNLTDIPNLSADGATRTLNAVENTVDEVGNTLTPAIEDVASRVGGAVSRVGEIGEQAGALASRVGGTVSRLGATASELAPDLAEGLGAVAAGSLEVPVAGEVVALLAGIGSAIASAFSPTPEKPTVAEIGADFSNTDEHGGNALSAY